MIEVKMSLPSRFPIIRQTPHSSGIWGNCRFHINQDIERCDYWVVFEGLSRPEKTRCKPKNTILITPEFPSIKPKYDPAFLDQFGTVMTFSRSLDHPRSIDMISPFPWFVGLTDPHNATDAVWDYDRLVSIGAPKKTKLISVISSDKIYTRGHRERIAFVDKLQRHFGESLDVFGRGRRDFPDKLDVLLDYKYHVALENSSCRNGISEKLYDPFLTLTYPIYYGAPNVLDYFSKQSLSVIDIGDPKRAILMIEKLISEDAYATALDSIKAARTSVLEKYNVFAILAEFCAREAEFPPKRDEETVVRIVPERPAVRGFKERFAGKFAKWRGLRTLRASKISRASWTPPPDK